jgi:hypothetical protein
MKIYLPPVLELLPPNQEPMKVPTAIALPTGTESTSMALRQAEASELSCTIG